MLFHSMLGSTWAQVVNENVKSVANIDEKKLDFDLNMTPIAA